MCLYRARQQPWRERVRHASRTIIYTYILTYTTITIFYVFVLTPEAPVSLYDACDLTYIRTNLPRTLESRTSQGNRRNFEPLWWFYEKFYASFVVQTVFFLFLSNHTFFSRILPVFFVDDRLATSSTVDRDDETRGRRGRYEEDEIRCGGSSGFLSSVMRYLLADSKIPRRNPFSGSLERTVRNVNAKIEITRILHRMSYWENILKRSKF